MKNLPNKIYLQLSENINITEDTDFNSLSEVTWCKDRINGNDIVYIRADLVQLNEEVRKDSVNENCVIIDKKKYKPIEDVDEFGMPHHH